MSYFLRFFGVIIYKSIKFLLKMYFLVNFY